jgi:NAD(P)-dependent dehydrogenase (short-subunit alcohol dehydrogenase family)
MNILDLKGENALITGAGQGVGRQIALHFAAHNAGTVYVNDYSAERANAVVAEIRATGARAEAVACDVTDFRAMQAKLEPLEIQMLVNNAGNAGADPARVGRGEFWEQSPEQWTPWLGVNLLGVLNASRLVLPRMIETKRGSIVTIISDAGRVGEPRLEVYSAAKAGAAGFSRALAKSVGRHGIRVNCVAISATRTPATSRGMDNPEFVKRALSHYVIRRFGEPSDVANMVLFVSSDAASWVTGQKYPVNGGYDFGM